MATEPRRVALLSGVTGFIGSHLAKGLGERGWQVHGLVRADADRSQLARVDADPTLHELDGEADRLREIASSVQPDVVIHVASLFLASHRPEDVEPLVRSNVLFGVQLLDASLRAGVRRFVNTGSSWQHHEDRDEPVNLYAATKQAFEAFVDAAAASSSLRAITLKLFDTYGPADPRRKLLRLLLDAADSGEGLAMSPGEQRIDLVHVSDVVEAFATAVEQLESQADGTHERFAVSSGRALSLRELVGLLTAAGATPEIEWGGRPYRDREVMQPWTGGETLPGWAPRIPLESGLAELVGGRAS